MGQVSGRNDGFLEYQLDFLVGVEVVAGTAVVAEKQHCVGAAVVEAAILAGNEAFAVFLSERQALVVMQNLHGARFVLLEIRSYLVSPPH